MEIERKFLIPHLPEDLETYPSKMLCQAYLNRSPVVRIRKKDNEYELTYKGSGLLAREEYNMPLTEAAFYHLLEKSDGRVIEKRRYNIPLDSCMIELDVFSGVMSGLWMAEVEFPSIDEANAFVPPSWFGEEVTFDPAYHNVTMAYGD